MRNIIKHNDDFNERTNTLLSHSGWAAQPWVTEGLRPSVCKPILTLASCPPTDSNSNWNWPKPSAAPGYIIVFRPPASAVPPLIYTGASLDWWLGRGSIYNTIRLFNVISRTLVWVGVPNPIAEQSVYSFAPADWTLKFYMHLGIN